MQEWDGKTMGYLPEYPELDVPLGLGGVFGIYRRHRGHEPLSSDKGSVAGDGGACKEGIFPHDDKRESVTGSHIGYPL